MVAIVATDNYWIILWGVFNAILEVTYISSTHISLARTSHPNLTARETGKHIGEYGYLECTVGLLSQGPSSKDSKGRGLGGREEPTMLVLYKEKQQETVSQNLSLAFSFPEPPSGLCKSVPVCPWAEDP